MAGSRAAGPHSTPWSPSGENVTCPRVLMTRVPVLQVRGGDDLLWAELQDHLPGGWAVESPRAPVLRSVSSSYQMSER